MGLSGDLSHQNFLFGPAKLPRYTKSGGPFGERSSILLVRTPNSK